jgi:hypothetical protein
MVNRRFQNNGDRDTTRVCRLSSSCAQAHFPDHDLQSYSAGDIRTYRVRPDGRSGARPSAGALLSRQPLTLIRGRVGWWRGVATGIAHALTGVWKRLQLGRSHFDKRRCCHRLGRGDWLHNDNRNQKTCNPLTERGAADDGLRSWPCDLAGQLDDMRLAQHIATAPDRLDVVPPA